ncbi:hypothetical protein DBR06_SOUSAS4510024, partial [Sousa chinensis]
IIFTNTNKDQGPQMCKCDHPASYYYQFK